MKRRDITSRVRAVCSFEVTTMARRQPRVRM
jgi:hypothetical protein